VSDGLVIRSVRHGDEAQFFAYLDDHLSDNGKNGTALFQPLSATDSRFPADKRIAFSSALATPYGQPGWRRARTMRSPATSTCARVPNATPDTAPCSGWACTATTAARGLACA
jgi:hypothetical protein